MDEMEIIAAATEESKEYTDQVFSIVAGGMKYMGSVATEEDLPTATTAIKGHVYTLRQNGHEFVCDGDEWIDLNQDLTAMEERINNLETRPLYPSAGRSEE